MKRLLICLSLIVGIAPGASALEWLTDLPTALVRAKREDKAVLLDFTGSDWCGWCKKLKSEVFDQFGFATYANANLIMVEVDFPRGRTLSVDQMRANENLAAKYRIQGYPTVILLNSDGQQIGQTGYVPGGPNAFIAQISRFPGMPRHGASETPAPAVSATKSRPAAQQPPPVLVPVAPSHYGELKLKGISGAGSRRMALINNETLMAGETADVKSFDTTIAVTVKEIRDDSAVIVVNGQTRELKLARR